MNAGKALDMLVGEALVDYHDRIKKIKSLCVESVKVLTLAKK